MTHSAVEYQKVKTAYSWRRYNWWTRDGNVECPFVLVMSPQPGAVALLAKMIG